MKISAYNIDFAKKTLGFGVVLALGVSAYAFAQTPPALPPLAALPDLAAANAGTPTPLPPFPGSDAASKALPPFGSLPGVTPAKSASAGNDISTAMPSDVLPPLADLPMPAPESSDKPFRKKTIVTSAADKNKPPPVGELPLLPSIPMAPGQEQRGVPLPLPVAIALPEVQVEPEEKTKSWETTLAPTSFPVETQFNFRRQLLPSTIYRTQYSEENEHLPKAVTRQDYEGLLFVSVMNNDVETARALLNAGTNINARNENGETPLAAAHQAGAVATEKLLMARGGR